MCKVFGIYDVESEFVGKGGGVGNNSTTSDNFARRVSSNVHGGRENRDLI